MSRSAHVFSRLLLSIFCLSIWTLNADAQRRGISLVRDAEIEALVQDYARPLMRAAGLRPGSVRFALVNDNSFNAFVSGRTMFLNTGLLLRAERPGEAIGVIAHELGHIVGGHQLRLRERVDEAMRIAKWTTLLGVGAAVAGSATGTAGLGSAGLAIASSGPSLARRSLLRYQRGEERAADRTAVALLRKTKQSGRGMLRTFKRLQQDAALLGRRIDPYATSHPLPAERLASLSQSITTSPHFKRSEPKSLIERHDMARAKIAAYTGGSRYAQAVLASKSVQPIARLYGRAITTYLYGSPRKALPQINKLIKMRPKNAYLHEMRGEILLRSGKAKQAVGAFQRAVRLDKTNAGFIRIELGHALLESGGRSSAKEAIKQLRRGLTRDPNTAVGYQHLARAYAELGNEAQSLLAAAELSIRTGRKDQAKNYARRAQAGFKRGSPGWLRAQDIITFR